MARRVWPAARNARTCSSRDTVGAGTPGTPSVNGPSGTDDQPGGSAANSSAEVMRTPAPPG